MTAKKSKSKKTVVVDVNTGEQVKKRYVTQFDYSEYPITSEKNNKQPSKTVPGQSMSVLEMIQRHRRGLPIDQAKGALYQGDELVEDISKMDLIDRQAYMDSVADHLVEVRTRLEEQAKTEEQKKFLREVDAEVRKRLSQIKPNPDPEEHNE